MFVKTLSKVMDRKDLEYEEMEEAMDALVGGDVPSEQSAAFLAALRTKGETRSEIGGAARALLKKARAVPGSRPLLVDNCGTGGDCKGTFNISTAAAFVVAGGGIPVAKHGNRSVSSRCGSADVAEALRAEMPDTPERALSCLDESGMVLLFAPHFHPVLKCLAPVRKSLGVRTMFNVLGPLLNPAAITHQVMGVFDPGVAPLLADVLLSLGRKGGMVVSGHGGFDELSLSGENRVVLFSEEGVRETLVAPEDAGLARRGGDELTGGDAGRNASIIEAVLSGRRGAARDAVILNAAAVFLASGAATDWREGAALAGESIDSGRAAAVLERIRRFSENGRAVPRSA